MPLPIQPQPSDLDQSYSEQIPEHKSKKPDLKIKVNNSNIATCSSSHDESCSPTHICNEKYPILSPLTGIFPDQIPSPSFPPPNYKHQNNEGATQILIDQQVPKDSSIPLSSFSFSKGDIETTCRSLPESPNSQCHINFSILESFARTNKDADFVSRNYYRPVETTTSFSRHRPLVPQSILQVDHNSIQESISKDEKDFLKKSAVPNSKDDSIAPKMEKQISTVNERRMSFTMDRFIIFTANNENKIQAPTLCSLLENGEYLPNLFSKKNGVWWLDCLDPTDDEMHVIGNSFGIHPLTVEDISQKESHEKVELFKNYYFLCFNTFNNDKDSEEFLDPITIYIVVFKEGIITFHFTPFGHTSNVRRRVRQLRDFVKVSSDWLCYAILDDITDSFAPIIQDLEIEIDVIEDSVYLSRKPDFGPMIRRIGESRNKVNLMLRLLSRKADVIKMFVKRCQEEYKRTSHEEISIYLSDVQDHVITMRNSLSIYEKMLSRSHANYLAQLQVESVNSNNRVTKVLGRVTLIGTVLVPLNLVTGLFGMNVRVPGQEGEDLKWFFGVIGFIVTLVIIFSLIANHWITEAEAPEPQLETKPKKKKFHAAAKKLNPFSISYDKSTDKRNY
ncbi:uncharacterized protein SAPINGB_P001392 [Magnusiomyces paraingens]|uniref:Uncharacterized protein n=1 Tax=Magnusiomyces paraingens TaxID=2606893 RepID=A0A5E8B606_9ASCO|nr:uncharacterized protein SAPINGB_P001392 [Saprochaete ingens]VVT46798.1 unnamed protein product [Saprochaete ingens]